MSSMVPSALAARARAFRKVLAVAWWRYQRRNSRSFRAVQSALATESGNDGVLAWCSRRAAAPIFKGNAIRRTGFEGAYNLVHQEKSQGLLEGSSDRLVQVFGVREKSRALVEWP